MRIGSLFSGAGVLDLAAEHVFGGNTVWHSELDYIEDKKGKRRPNAATKVLAHRWPGVPNLGDVSDQSPDRVPAPIPARRPAALMSWQGKPPQSTSMGSTCDQSTALSPAPSTSCGRGLS